MEIKHYVDMRSHPEQYLAHGRRSVFVLFLFSDTSRKKERKKEKVLSNIIQPANLMQNWVVQQSG